MQNNGREASTEVIHKELDMIQACITRMAQNSFIIKGWFVSLVAVSIALKISNPITYSILLFALGFCFYFVNLQFYVYERQYRELYNGRIKLRVEEQDGITDLYKLGVAGFKKKSIIEYAPKNKMLIIFYFTVPLIFSIINYFMSQSSDIDTINIEIQGLKGLLR